MISHRLSKNISIGVAIFVALTLSLFPFVPAYAQVVGATLSGTVTDASHAAMPNVQISIKNTATAVTRVVTTDSAGYYSAPNLPAGTYDVTFRAAGFSTVTSC